MNLYSDFHIHSKYSRATSPRMDIPNLAKAAKLKGINLIGTGDFTHGKWLEEIRGYLGKESAEGIYEYDGVKFILTSEMSCIFEKDGKTRKIHTVYFAPNFEAVTQINDAIGKYGKMEEDGRPIFTISAAELTEKIMGVCPECFVMPAHIWTPWFSLFGSKSGFDRVKDGYEDMEKHIGGMETGLSSDPEMNWMVSQLDKYAIISNSDAHSPEKIGREMNVLNISENELSYKGITSALKNKKIERTIEYFPEEGKYHFDGHRNCNVSMHPEEALERNNICPVCRKPLTIGVLHRVYELADRKCGEKPKDAVPFVKWVPLNEIAAILKIKEEEYKKIIEPFGNEMNLFNADEKRLREIGEFGEKVIEVRNGNVHVEPGYDGVFGKVALSGSKKEEKKTKEKKKMKTLFEYE